MTISLALFVAFVALASGAPGILDQEKREEECFSQEKVYDRFSGKCHKLLTKGPCPSGEWFVLDGSWDWEEEIKGVCVEEKCGFGEYYWKWSGTCVKAEDKNYLCKDSRLEEIRHNLFGEGECFCKSGPPSARLDNDESQPCYEMYTRGPCNYGQILGIRDSQTNIPTCIRDPCLSMRASSPDVVLAPWRNNSCYELGTQGPCQDGLTFKVHSHYLTPSCVSLSNKIFDLDYPCYPDEENECQKIVSRTRSSYKMQIHRLLRKRRDEQLSQILLRDLGGKEDSQSAWGKLDSRRLA